MQINSNMTMIIMNVLFIVLGVVLIIQNVTFATEAPIVGILSQEVRYNKFVSRVYGRENYTSYIAASYVKFIEGAGGRVIPIWIGQARSYYEALLTKINGVLLPGGAVYFNNTAGYGEAGAVIIDIAVDMNKRGIYMPIWGTCLGMELLVYHLANGSDPRTHCHSTWQALPLELKKDFLYSRLFGGATVALIDIWQKEPVTANYHNWCFTEWTFAKIKLNEYWKVLSLNHDWNGIEFISSLEHKKYPFYGVQFHPEKNIYEFSNNHNVTHTSQAVRSSQYFADFFVNEARKNNNTFNNRTEEANALIYNYYPHYTGSRGSSFVQLYFFREHGAVGNGVNQRGVNRSRMFSTSLRTIVVGFSLVALCQRFINIKGIF